MDKLEEILKNYSKNVELSLYTSIGLGGRARFLVEAKSIKELVDCVGAARTMGVPYKVLGFGSNILVSDKGFDGLIIINKTSAIEIDESKSRVIVDSGVALSKMILEAASHGLSALEPMFGIPGTVGGALCVNAGAHGASISSCLKSATLMISTDKIVSVQPEWFEFGYRTSKLKYKKDEFPPIVLSAIFQFQKKKPEDISSEIAKYKKWREQNQPIGQKTTGSVFRNLTGRDKNDDQKERTAGFLLDSSGAKKLKLGGVHVSKKHANWIINEGGSTSSDARKLIEQMRKLVIDKYSVALEEEIEYLGDWQ